MFIQFFYTLRDVGIPVSPTSFLLLQRAMGEGLVNSLDDFYTAARAILVKSEKYFDLYDQVFAHTFEGADLAQAGEAEFDLVAAGLLDEWLKNPKRLAHALGLDEKKLASMSPEEVLAYFKKRLQDQKERHAGGSKWIGTGGTSPVGHSGYHPGGMRVGGESMNRSAVKVAGERRYRDYSTDGPLTRRSLTEGLKRLRHLVPQGVRDRINVDSSIYQTIRNGGEIELVFDRATVDRLKIILAIDNGGWSMEPYVDVVQALFNSARTQFKELKTLYFHNTIYDQLWEDASRMRRPVAVDDLIRRDPESRLIIIGDASMAPYELMATDGSIHAFERSGRPSIERLRLLAATFPHAAWLNPIPKRDWQFTRTIELIRAILPMFELSLDGLDQAVAHLMRR
ncbi:hypothetical protein JWG42_07140 [Desulfoprunum benzoelyticum]|uniref:VWA containing CoxE family protein n=1 Tax=Desulfoprunum benzoelyticum TaxID=1506996 RepID=A0A840URA7_9BACT|nr:hypothetical protein [Desulfoprunum benzoelyticum]MBB5348757.1 hypothetical protein [Desulfoprunum benzoelyticum]MBM9529918.1 hypothetical protein [Desulfoprunum benzoelyticum]